MNQESIAAAVKQICDEKGVSVEAVITTIEAALAAAYRKDFGEKNQNIKAEFELETGRTRIFDVKEIVADVPEEELAALEAEEAARAAAKASDGPRPRFEEKPRVEKTVGAEGETEEEVRRFNPKTMIQISDAKKVNKKYEVGEEIVTELEIPGDFGRMAAQTAKQVIVQKLRETERETIFEEFKEKKGEILVGTVQRREGPMVLIDLGRTTALMPPEEQIRAENYMPGTHIKVYVTSVTQTTKGPEIIVSRAHPEIVRKLFFTEIPEVASGVVEIKNLAREAGSRSKIAVYTEDDNIDPIGSCIGQRGARIQTIISELKGEKVDIIKYSENPVEYITNALSPAKILQIDLDETNRVARAKVAEDQLSLAIGKGGQNVRLAARLTGWKIDIVSDGNKKVDAALEDGEAETDAASTEIAAEGAESEVVAEVAVLEEKEEKTDTADSAASDAADTKKKKKKKKEGE